jgi:class 3 adenylate cyclase
MAKDATALLEELAANTKAALDGSIDVQKVRRFPDLSQVPLNKPSWRRLDDVVAVACDLKGSTRISYSKQERVAAKLYEASTGNCVRVLREFGPDFIDIQGDGVFALFHGDLSCHRAMAAALTLKSFSFHLLGPALDDLFKEAADNEDPDADPFHSGLKIGMARGTLLVKRIGVRGEHNEPVWAGKPVNYAVKCAQAADRHELVITGRVFDQFKDNDYVRYSCDCTQPISAWWTPRIVDTIGKDGTECWVFPNHTKWCAKCGNAFCRAIRSGASTRDLTPADRAAAHERQEAA